MRLALVLAMTTAAATVSACGKPAEAPATPTAVAPAAAPSAPDRQKALATLPAPYNTADLANGEAKFALCRSCHTTVKGGANMTGPNLYGVFGRKAASVADFNYSDALKASGITWDAAQIDGWIARPQDFLKGTKMSFAGLKEAKDRTDLIAFLMVETGATP